MRTSIVIVSPIARPAIDLNAPPGSTAVAQTAHTRKKVMMISRTKPLPAPKPAAACGTAARNWSCVKSPRRIAAATSAPPNCAIQ